MHPGRETPVSISHDRERRSGSGLGRRPPFGEDSGDQYIWRPPEVVC